MEKGIDSKRNDRNFCTRVQTTSIMEGSSNETPLLTASIPQNLRAASPDLALLAKSSTLHTLSWTTATERLADLCVLKYLG